MSLYPVDQREAVAQRYAEHLTATDPLTMAGGRPEQAAALRAQPGLLLDMLDRPGVADSLLSPRVEDAARFTYVSPFLVFAAAVPRASATPRSARPHRTPDQNPAATGQSVWHASKRPQRIRCW